MTLEMKKRGVMTHEMKRGVMTHEMRELRRNDARKEK